MLRGGTPNTALGTMTQHSAGVKELTKKLIALGALWDIDNIFQTI